MMQPLPGHHTQIDSSDFERFVSDLAGAIWNDLIEQPKFKTLRPNDFPELYEIVFRTLTPFHKQTLAAPRKKV